MREHTTRSIRRALPALWIAAALLAAGAGGAAGAEEPMEGTPGPDPGLPAELHGFQRDGGARRIDAATIFDYMNGAGELYLAYRFEHLDAVEYRAADGATILVEIYTMGHADDVWGLQSEDWTGEALALGTLTADGRRALYGAGLLRMACGRRWVRVLASHDGPEARRAVLAIGEALATDCPAQSAPAIVGELPATIDAAGRSLALRSDRVRFLRSQLVLNNVYYLAADDLLGLGRDADAVYAEYRPPGGDHTTRIHVVRARYPDEAAAGRGARGFVEGYVEQPPDEGPVARRLAVAVEDGWIGLSWTGRRLDLVFGAGDEVTVDAALRALDASSPGSPAGGAR